jgi:hypothetical protein
MSQKNRDKTMVKKKKKIKDGKKNPNRKRGKDNKTLRHKKKQKGANICVGEIVVLQVTYLANGSTISVLEKSMSSGIMTPQGESRGASHSSVKSMFFNFAPSHIPA